MRIPLEVEFLIFVRFIADSIMAGLRGGGEPYNRTTSVVLHVSMLMGEAYHKASMRLV